MIWICFIIFFYIKLKLFLYVFQRLKKILFTFYSISFFIHLISIFKSSVTTYDLENSIFTYVYNLSLLKRRLRDLIYNIKSIFGSLGLVVFM